MKSVLASLSIVVLLNTADLIAQAGPNTAAPPANGGLPAVKPAPTVPPDYRLVTGDKLRIEVYREPQLSHSLQIRPDGRITLPLAGDLVAAGQTPAALRDAIATSLKQYVTNPVVTVIVVETEPPTISVMGEVNHPGSVPLKGRMTVLEALATAGGFKDFANTKNIIIRRPTPTGVETIKFNYKDAIRATSQPWYVQAGDMIIVP